jgi:hypothetical protein
MDQRSPTDERQIRVATKRTFGDAAALNTLAIVNRRLLD